MRTTLVFAAGALFVGGLAAVASAEVAGAKPSAHVHIVPTTADHRMARSVEAIEAARTPRLIAVLREKHAHNAAWFGATVAVSNDGRTLLIGATDESNDRGAAWIYSKVRSRWLPEARLARPTPTRGDLFGSEVALSGDGLTALVSSIGYHHRIGAVWVYRRTGSGWRLGARLTARDEVGQAEFGWAVALSADGATALIGGPVDNPPKGFRGHLGAGAAWVFHRTDGTWAQEGPKLTGVGETDTGVFGAAVALSADGRTALVGAGYAHSGRGTAWTFVRSRTGWKKEGAPLYPNDARGLPQFGTVTALSSNGRTAVISGPADDHGHGAIWTFARNGSRWVQRGKKLTTKGQESVNFGGSLAISSNSTTMLIGGVHTLSDRGRVWLYTRTLPRRWTQRGTDISPAGSTGAHALFGEETAISADGHLLVIGAPGYRQRQGAVWIYG